MGIGPWHLLALIVIILIFFGPSKLPTLGKSMGEAIRGFKKGIVGDEIDVTESAKLKPGADEAASKQAQTEREKA